MTLQVTLVDEGTALVGDQRLSTTEVGELIEALAFARAQMNPPVPSGWTLGPEGIDVTNQPATKLSATADGTLLMVMRHEGFGWLAFDFETEYIARLRDAFAAMARDITGGPSLEDPETGRDHPTQ